MAELPTIHPLEAQILEFLRGKTALPNVPEKISQSLSVQESYVLAKRYKTRFNALIERVGLKIGATGFPRPSPGIKSLERTLEKARDGIVPLDLLGGKFVVDSLEQAYFVAGQIPKHFQVIGFKDRHFKPQKSGYRDLQFIVAIRYDNSPSLLVEVKVILRSIDEVSETEHRLYEYRRSLDALAESRPLTPTEQGIRKFLQETTPLLYNEQWIPALEAVKR
jgi:hypothetical protein